MIIINHCADESRRRVRERIFVQEREDIGRAFQQLDAKLYEPGIVPVTAQRSEPHLPVEPGLVRRHETWPAFEIAGLIFEAVIEPFLTVRTSLNHDLRPGNSHYGEEPIAVSYTHLRAHETPEHL